MGAQTDSGALLPDLEPLLPESVEETVDQQQENLISVDESLAALATDPGFQVIKEYLVKQRDGLMTGKTLNINDTDTYEIIGQKYTTGSAVAGIADHILSMVENAQSAIAEREARKREAEQNKR